MQELPTVSDACVFALIVIAIVIGWGIFAALLWVAS